MDDVLVKIKLYKHIVAENLINNFQIIRSYVVKCKLDVTNCMFHVINCMSGELYFYEVNYDYMVNLSMLNLIIPEIK